MASIPDYNYAGTVQEDKQDSRDLIVFVSVSMRWNNTGRH